MTVLSNRVEACAGGTAGVVVTTTRVAVGSTPNCTKWPAYPKRRRVQPASNPGEGDTANHPPDSSTIVCDPDGVWSSSPATPAQSTTTSAAPGPAARRAGAGRGSLHSTVNP